MTATAGTDHAGGTPLDLRIGTATDVHAFDADRPLWLAGLHWSGEVGLAGHSDADVALHAACDALLAAAGLGDLGQHFGTSAPRWAGAPSADLLAETMRLVRDANYTARSLSIQIIGNSPRFAPRRLEAQALVRELAGCPVSISATTTDGLGLTGRGEGIAAISTALLVADPSTDAG